MAKFELKFICSHDSKEQDFIKAELDPSCGDVEKKTILITLQMDGEEGYVFLDKSTAIKFAKTLRTEINKITETNI